MENGKLKMENEVEGMEKECDRKCKLIVDYECWFFRFDWIKPIFLLVLLLLIPDIRRALWAIEGIEKAINRNALATEQCGTALTAKVLLSSDCKFSCAIGQSNGNEYPWETNNFIYGIRVIKERNFYPNTWYVPTDEELQKAVIYSKEGE